MKSDHVTQDSAPTLLVLSCLLGRKRVFVGKKMFGLTVNWMQPFPSYYDESIVLGTVHEVVLADMTGRFGLVVIYPIFHPVINNFPPDAVKRREILWT